MSASDKTIPQSLGPYDDFIKDPILEDILPRLVDITSVIDHTHASDLEQVNPSLCHMLHLQHLEQLRVSRDKNRSYSNHKSFTHSSRLALKQVLSSP